MTGIVHRSGRALLPAVLAVTLAVTLASGCAAAGAAPRSTSAAPLPAVATTSAAPAVDPVAPAVTVTVPGLTAPRTETGTRAVGGGVINETETAEDSETADVAVDLTTCRGCREVLATAPQVAGQWAAALVSTRRGAVLVAVAPDGSAGKPQAVTHGAVFEAPADGALPCDADGRCIVLARQRDGDAIASAYLLGADGTWLDLSGENAFPSATDRAAVIDVAGEPGIAVQESGGGRTGWIVLTWSGARYTVYGCAADPRRTPTVAELSLEACLS